MVPERSVPSFAVDLSRMHGRTVTSFYSNLVTRPTGRAIRMGVESQIAELRPSRQLCLSILDFSQVRVIDYSCADEIVAKLLLRYAARDRPAEAYFLIRGLQEHHVDAVEAVLERHAILAAAQDAPGEPSRLLGPSNPFERACWGALVGHGRATLAEISERAGISEEVVEPTLLRLAEQRVLISLGAGVVCELAHLTQS